jgi:membrane-associated protease RseP (regulator of RpoE activity)
MAKKHALYLLLAITLSASVALSQQRRVNPPAPADPQGFEPPVSSFSFLIEGEGFLGVNTEDINKENMGRYNLRDARGVGVTSVVKDSPAEKAGIRKDDVILRVDGDNVTSVRKLSRLISEIAPDQSVRITISRGGAEQEVTATIAKRDESPRFEGRLRGFPDVFRGSPEIWRMEGMPSLNGLNYAFGNSRRIGVSTIPLTKQLAAYFGIADGKGLLVTSVTEDGPAAKAGLKAGDVIVSVDGEKVEAAGDVSRVINKKKDGDVAITIVRNKSQQTIRVTPKEGDSPFVVPSSTRIGRQIVIPRIELPEIPAVNVAIPRIELPVIPQINIEIPVIKPVKVKRTQRVRTI